MFCTQQFKGHNYINHVTTAQLEELSVDTANQTPRASLHRRGRSGAVGGGGRRKTEEALEDLPWNDEKGPSSIRPTTELFQIQHWENSWETWSSFQGLCRGACWHRILNSTSRGLSLGTCQYAVCLTVPSVQTACTSSSLSLSLFFFFCNMHS